MDYSNKCCPNPACSDSQKYGQDNIVFHEGIGKDKKRARGRCRTCRPNFRETKGTLFEQSRVPWEKGICLSKGGVHGKSIEATADICAGNSNSVSRGVTMAGEHPQAVHALLVQELKMREGHLAEFWAFVTPKRRTAPQRSEKQRGINGDM